ncbi:c-type cytochrome [Marinimicrobium alkaliphilum]|uniref:c-type cytochrome n=1 Tax=Marinimicrobium alkaliphilum TaxID=2202654 RepID=UPI000DB931B1|nr:cytochrome c [Marinimicrobium alkaliphilum]
MCLCVSLPRLFLIASALLFALGFAAPTLADPGKAGYARHCQACHQASGDGIPGVFPPLANNNNINNNPQYLAEAIVQGVSGPLEVNGQRYNGTMPAMGYISDQEVAAIVNYIMERWGESEQRLAQDDVKTLR